MPTVTLCGRDIEYDMVAHFDSMIPEIQEGMTMPDNFKDSRGHWFMCINRPAIVGVRELVIQKEPRKSEITVYLKCV